MKRAIVFLLAVLFVTVLSADEIVLTRDGVPAATIVLEARPTRAARFAAAELAHLIWRITGARLPVVEEGSQHIDGLPIRIGGRKEFDRPEAYRVEVSPEGILLTGSDDADFGKFDYGDFHTFPAEANVRKATTYAVYHFLEQFVNVRFYGFGDDGVVFDLRPTLTVKSGEYSGEPCMTMCRKFYFRSQQGVSERDLALLKARWRENSINGEVNHNVWSIYFRYWGPATGTFFGPLDRLFIERRPEYFASGYPGQGRECALYTKFTGDDRDDIPPQLCSSNPGPVEYFANEAKAVFDGKTVPGARIQPRVFPGADYYYPIVEEDNKSWCQCAACQASFADVPQERRQSCRHFDWINRIARAARQLDSRIGLITLAYSNSLPHPGPEVELESNVAVQMCLAIDSWFHPGLYVWQHGPYREWVRQEAQKRPLSVWVYMLSPGFEAGQFFGYGDAVSLLYPWKAGEIFQEFARDGIQGYFAEQSSTDLALEPYVINRVSLYGADADVPGLLTEYFHRYYGAAGDAMEQFYREMESIVWNPENYPSSIMEKVRKTSFAGGSIHTADANQALMTSERTARLDALLEKAQAASLSDVERRRLDQFIVQVWQPARRAGEAYAKRQQFSLPEVPATQAEAFDTLENWQAKHSISLLCPLLGASPVKTDPASVELGHDGVNLVVRFHENGDEAFRHRDAGLWLNNVELFAGSSAAVPVAHYAVGVDGTLESLVHDVSGEVARVTPRKLKNTKVESRCDESGWHFTLTVPLAELVPNAELKPGMRFFLQIARIRRFPGGESRLWSGIASGTLDGNFDRMGKVLLSPTR